MRARKLHWKTASESAAVSKPIGDFDSVDFKPQEIRAFLIDYSVKASTGNEIFTQ